MSLQAQKNTGRAWLFWTLVTWTLFISLCRALRLPNDFSEIHWLLDYRFGFMKRGLIGSLCSVATGVLGVPMNPSIIISLASVSYICLYGTFLILLFRMLRQNTDQRNMRLVALVFATSPFVVMNAHLFGYFDALIYTFTIVSAALILTARPLCAAWVSVIALLTHESYLLMGFPLVCLTTALHISARDSTANKMRHGAALGLPLVTFVLILLAQSLFVDLMALREQLTAHLAQFEFLPTRRGVVANWQTTGFFEFFQQQRQHLVRRLLNPEFLAIFGPSLLAFLYFIHSTYRIRPFGLLSMAVLGVIACPLVMHAIAWDTARITSYVVGGAFIATWIFTETRSSQRTDDMFPLIALPVIVLNVFARTPLMDKELDGFTNLGRFIFYAPTLAALAYIVTKARKSDCAN